MADPITNPFAAPEVDPNLPISDDFEGSFKLIPGGIRCRAAARLPRICLVTGATDQLGEYKFQRRTEPQSLMERVVALSAETVFWGLLLIQVPDLRALAPSWLPPAITDSNALFTFTTWIMILGAWLFRRKTRNRETHIIAYVSEPVTIQLRLRLCGAAFAFLCALGVTALIPPKFHLLARISPLVSIAAFFTLLPSRLDKGIRLSQHGEGWFDVVGFSQPFLSAIDDNQQKTKEFIENPKSEILSCLQEQRAPRTANDDPQQEATGR